MASIFYIPGVTASGLLTDATIGSIISTNTDQDLAISSQDTRLIAAEAGIQTINDMTTELALPNTHTLRNADNQTYFDKVNINAFKSNNLNPIDSTMDIGTNSATATINLGTGAHVNTINIGTGSGVSTINIGGPGDTVAISGTLTTVNTATLEVEDKNILLNQGGLANSAVDSGIQFEEGGIKTGHILVDSSRTGFILQPPSFYNVTPDLNHIYLGEEGLRIKNLNEMGIETYYSDDATKRVRLYVSSAGTDAGATVLTNKEYSDLRLYAYNNNVTPKQIMLRNEARTANLFSSSNDTGELQIMDNAATKLAYVGKAITRFTSPAVQFSGACTLESSLSVAASSVLAGVTATTLSVNSIDLTPTTATYSGNWTGPATVSGSVTVRKIGNIVFLTATPVATLVAGANSFYWTFSAPIAASFRPAALTSGTAVINHDANTVPSGVSFVNTVGEVLLYNAEPGAWTIGNTIGFNNGFSLFWFV